MKKFFLLSFIGLSLTACSADQDELDLNANEIQEFNVSYEDCPPVVYQFGDKGYIEVSNNEETLKIRIVANEGYNLVNTRLHIAGNLQAFPIAGNGNLPPGQMAYHVPNPDSAEHIFEFNLNDYPESIFIASQSIFTNGVTSQTAWAGTPAGNKGSWSYFQYTVQYCEVGCTEFLGEDYTSERIPLSSLIGWEYEDLEKYVFSSLLADAPEGGTFSPTLESIFDRFNDGSVPNGPFTTTYTVSVDGCEDSILIGATVYR